MQPASLRPFVRMCLPRLLRCDLSKAIDTMKKNLLNYWQNMQPISLTSVCRECCVFWHMSDQVLLLCDLLVYSHDCTCELDRKERRTTPRQKHRRERQFNNKTQRKTGDPFRPGVSYTFASFSDTGTCLGVYVGFCRTLRQGTLMEVHGVGLSGLCP